MSRKAASILAISLILAALLPSAWLAWRFRSMPQMGAYHDDAMYLQSAKSLAEGRGYRIPSLPDTPYQTKYPPVFPFLMSLIWRMDPQFPGNLSKLTALCWSMLPLYVLLLYRVLNRWGLAPLESAAICALTALSPHFVLAGMMTMSELTFGVFSLVAIWYLERGTAESNRGLLMLAGAAGGLAFLTRTQGIAMLIGAVAFFAWRKQWSNAAAFGSVFGAGVLGWFVWTRTHSYPGVDPVTIYYVDYVRFYAASVQWNEIPQLVWINVDSILSSAARLIFAYLPMETSWRMFAWVVAAASIGGIRRLVRQSGQYHMAFFALAAFVLLVPWNWPPNERYLLPIWPAISAGFYAEMRHLFQSCRTVFGRPELSQKAVAAGFLAVLVAACSLIPYRNYDGTVRNLPLVFQYYRNMTDARVPAYEWIRKNVPAEAQILTYDDPLLYLYTGRRGLAMPIVHWVTYDGTPKRLEAYFATAPEFMREHNLDFAVMADGDFHRDLETVGRNAFQAALSNAGWFEPVLQSPGAQVYRLKSEAGLQPGASVAHAPAGTWWASVRQSTPAIR
ncbi:MAG TPA: glycosyltransferase family 39 protein [Bryobacteraceae bacterium]|nr:glycosyltransferase family 39 protein [Bryobacteraceae bacterium]